MKTLIYLFFCTALILPSLNGQVQIPEEIAFDGDRPRLQTRGLEYFLVAARRDISTLDWEPADSIRYFYDAENRLHQSLSLAFNGSDWVNSIQYEAQYQGNTTTEIRSLWDGSNWVNNRKDSNTYNADGNPLEYISQTWTNGNWANQVRLAYTYSPTGLLEEYIVYYWGTEAVWVPNLRQHYQYDGDLRTEETTAFYNVDTELFEVVDKDVYAYNASDLIESITTLALEDGLFVNAARRLFSYNLNGYRTTILREAWDEATASWIAYSRNTIEYNPDDLPATTTDEYFDETTSLWIPGYRFLSEYDSESNEIWLTYQEYFSDTWNNIERRQNYYEQFLVAIQSLSPPENRLAVTPNPTSGDVQIQLEADRPQEGQLAILNPLGQVLLQRSIQIETGDNQFYFDLGHLPAGQYYVVWSKHKQRKSAALLIKY